MSSHLTRLAAAAVLPALLATSGTAVAADRNAHPFGLGVIVGQPTGLSGKVYLDRRAQAVDFAVATTPWAGVYGHATYLWHPSVLASGQNVDLEWHLGVGGQAWTRRWLESPPERSPYGVGDGDVAVGVRVPIGLDVNLGDPRLQFFGDIAATGYVVPEPRPGFDAAVGARYYF
ncbi:MAG: hypothetical protein R3F61_01870 [Myxococcota bacterium]